VNEKEVACNVVVETVVESLQNHMAAAPVKDHVRRAVEILIQHDSPGPISMELLFALTATLAERRTAEVANVAEQALMIAERGTMDEESLREVFNQLSTALVYLGTDTLAAGLTVLTLAVARQQENKK
jgi:hypothetical protein